MQEYFAENFVSFPTCTFITYNRLGTKINGIQRHTYVIPWLKWRRSSNGIRSWCVCDIYPRRRRVPCVSFYRRSTCQRTTAINASCRFVKCRSITYSSAAYLLLYMNVVCTVDFVHAMVLRIIFVAFSFVGLLVSLTFYEVLKEAIVGAKI